MIIISIYGKIVEVNKLYEAEKNIMFSLMNKYYDNMMKTAFLRDLDEKDYCILLYNKDGEIKGFSTQKLMEVKLEEETIRGVFSGDTIIDRDYWGSLELYKVFVRHFITFGRKFDKFYWFLISKGYKTYKILPVFLNEYYPNYKIATPPYEQSIMHALGKAKFPDEYDEDKGVVCYKKGKDRLKEGIADITEQKLKDKHIEFFNKINPGYINGDDVVCLASLKADNLNKTAKRLLFSVKE
ncbi:MAG: hypothetical protein Q8942_07155 [Bacillota bacterium]|nr:hypothetical protein [Bacillota bacterium]